MFITKKGLKSSCHGLNKMNDYDLMYHVDVEDIKEDSPVVLCVSSIGKKVILWNAVILFKNDYFLKIFVDGTIHELTKHPNWNNQKFDFYYTFPNRNKRI